MADLPSQPCGQALASTRGVTALAMLSTPVALAGAHRPGTGGSSRSKPEFATWMAVLEAESSAAVMHEADERRKPVTSSNDRAIDSPTREAQPCPDPVAAIHTIQEPGLAGTIIAAMAQQPNIDPPTPSNRPQPAWPPVQLVNRAALPELGQDVATEATTLSATVQLAPSAQHRSHPTTAPNRSPDFSQQDVSAQLSSLLDPSASPSLILRQSATGLSLGVPNTTADDPQALTGLRQWLERSSKPTAKEAPSGPPASEDARSPQAALQKERPLQLPPQPLTQAQQITGFEAEARELRIAKLASPDLGGLLPLSASQLVHPTARLGFHTQLFGATELAEQLELQRSEPSLAASAAGWTPLILQSLSLPELAPSKSFPEPVAADWDGPGAVSSPWSGIAGHSEDRSDTEPASPTRDLSFGLELVSRALRSSSKCVSPDANAGLRVASDAAKASGASTESNPRKIDLPPSAASADPRNSRVHAVQNPAMASPAASDQELKFLVSLTTSARMAAALEQSEPTSVTNASQWSASASKELQFHFSSNKTGKTELGQLAPSLPAPSESDQPGVPASSASRKRTLPIVRDYTHSTEGPKLPAADRSLARSTRPEPDMGATMLSSEDFEPSSATQPVRRLTLEARPREGTQVRVQLLDRQGQLEVWVRASDPRTAAELRHELSQLIQRLEEAGFSTESVIVPPGAESSLSGRAPEQSQESNDGWSSETPSGRRWDGSDEPSQQQANEDREQAWREAWLAETTTATIHRAEGKQ